MHPSLDPHKAGFRRRLQMIEGFEDFTPDNDPHGEHDAGFLYRDVIGQWHTRWTDDSTRPALSVMWKFRSEEHTSELQSLMRISYAVFCLKKKNKRQHDTHYRT